MRPSRARWTGAVLLQLALLAVAALLALCLGSSRLPLSALLGAVTGRAETLEAVILFDIRLPRMVLAFAVGGGLSLAGVLLQGMFRNPLVEPYTLGISGGASLGLCLGVVLHVGEQLGGIALPAMGFAGAGATALIVYGLGTRRGAMNIHDVVLIGVMISFVCSSLVMLIMAMSRAEDLHGIVFWTMGSLEEPNRLLIGTALGVSLLSLAAGYLFAVSLNGMALGEDGAANLGIHVERTKRGLFVLAALLTGVSVSVAGVIGFVGLVVPHVVRLLVGGDHRILLVSAYLSGATFLILCDTAARIVIAPMEMPVGVVTGIVGGTTFVYLLSRDRGGGAAW